MWFLLPITSPFFKNATHIYNSIKYLCTNKMGLSKCDENVVNDSWKHTLKWIVHISQVLQHIFVSMLFLSTTKYKSSTKQDFKIITKNIYVRRLTTKLTSSSPFVAKMDHNNYNTKNPNIKPLTTTTTYTIDTNH